MCRARASAVCRAALYAASFCMWAATATAAAPAQFTASRTTDCVAPCAVLFDATATDDPAFLNDFQSLYYAWDFDDDLGESWSISGEPKNLAVGALAGHVYTVAGTFHPVLTVRNLNGAVSTASVEITVTDPDVVFAGAATRCLSALGEFDGCPAGAEQVTSSDLEEHLANADGRRTLLRRAESFTSAEIRLVDASTSGSILGAFGALGPKPTITDIGIRGAPGWRVMDIHMFGPGLSGPTDQGPTDIALLGIPQDFTVLRVDVDNWNRCIQWFQPQQRITGNAVVDFTCDDFPPNGAASKIFEASSESMWMGLHIDGSTAVGGVDEFLLRSVFTYKEVIQHSKFEGSPQNRNAIQLRGCFVGLYDWCENLGTPSQYLIFSDNHIIEERGKVGAIIKTAHNTGGTGGTLGNANLDFIFERNLFQVANILDSETLLKIFELQATHAMIRNNLFDLQKLPTGAASNRLVDIRDSLTPGIDQGSLQILNNTIYIEPGFPNSFTIADNRSLGSGHACINNLVYAPGIQGALEEVTGSGWITAGNLFSGGTEPGFFTGSPFAFDPLPAHLEATIKNMGAFRLDPSSAITGGTSPVGSGYDYGADPLGAHTAAFDDLYGDCRFGDNGWDVGANQRGVAPCDQRIDLPPAAPPAPTLLPPQ